MHIQQATAATVMVGPILDEDGLPYAVASIPSTAFRVSINGAAGVAVNDTTGAIADGSQGHYRLSVNATDTANLGSLIVRLELANYAMRPVDVVVVPFAIASPAVDITDVAQQRLVQAIGKGTL